MAEGSDDVAREFVCRYHVNELLSHTPTVCAIGDFGKPAQQGDEGKRRHVFAEPFDLHRDVWILAEILDLFSVPGREKIEVMPVKNIEKRCNIRMRVTLEGDPAHVILTD